MNEYGSTINSRKPIKAVWIDQFKKKSRRIHRNKCGKPKHSKDLVKQKKKKRKGGKKKKGSRGGYQNGEKVRKMQKQEESGKRKG